MTTNDDLLKELNKHGEVLARLDERTDFLVKAQDKHDSRLTYLERRDTMGNIISAIIASIAAGFSIFHHFDG